MTCTRPVSAVVGELESEVEVLGLEQADDGLQVVLFLRRDPQLLALDLRSDPARPLVPDDLGDLLRVLLGDALLEDDRDAVLLAGPPRLGRVQVLEGDPPLDELVLEDVEDRLSPLLAVGADFHAMLSRAGDGRSFAAEVEPVADFLRRLVQRVIGFLAVDLADDVKAGLARHDHQVRRVRSLSSHRTLRIPVCAAAGTPATMPEGPRRNQSCCPLFFSLPPHRAVLGRLPEWPKGAVCKTVGSAYVGSNPTPATKCGNGPLAGNSRLCGPFDSASSPLSSDVLAVMPSGPSRYGT